MVINVKPGQTYLSEAGNVWHVEELCFEPGFVLVLWLGHMDANQAITAKEPQQLRFHVDTLNAKGTRLISGNAEGFLAWWKENAGIGEVTLSGHTTSTAHLDAFYKLSHALQYIAQTRVEPWEVEREFLPVERILRPLIEGLRKPFVEAGIFKAR